MYSDCEGRTILSKEAFSNPPQAQGPPTMRHFTSSAAPAYCKKERKEVSTTVTKNRIPRFFFIAVFNLCFFNHMHSRKKVMCSSNLSAMKQ